MHITHVHIENFKGFHGAFDLELNDGLNILVGDNEAGKSTILEAINLALSGVFNGKYIRYELSQYLFNNQIVVEYVQSLKSTEPLSPPYVLIEIFIDGEDIAELEGNFNYTGEGHCGVRFKIEFNEKYKTSYEELVKSGDVTTIPIEYYDIDWRFFSRDPITARDIPLKASLIDSSKHRYQSGSDVYISRIVKDILQEEDVVAISQAHRHMREQFMADPSVQKINSKIKDASEISDKEINVSVDLATRNAWENSLMTYLDEVPFNQIGKGEQTVVKTKLALSHKKAKEANVILLEEPENHLAHMRLNQLIAFLKSKYSGKQIIVSTHSSFVANKLGLQNLIFLNNQATLSLKSLDEPTYTFFEKLAGYDTLRLILCKKAILVEGASDELVIQKAYMKKNGGRLPIEDNTDVISVGLSFLRFLEIAKKLNLNVAVVTDNDGDIEALKKKYINFIGDQAKPNIGIFYDPEIDDCGEIDGKKYNCNTLEPKLVKVNDLAKMNDVLGKDFDNLPDLYKHMRSNKTECALKIFNYSEEFTFPQYILDAIENV
ncbi:MAG TPA: ATP-dependent endonuclease [Clostridiales bacterium]|nr:ATP-dependent endonuclease [Clostridiales bacterium]